VNDADPAQPELRLIRQGVEGHRELVNRTQRQIAHGRSTVVAVHGRVSGFQHPLDRRADQTDPGPPLDRRIAGIVARLDRIHGRLLLLSAAVERESDRLDIACQEINRLVRAD